MLIAALFIFQPIQPSAAEIAPIFGKLQATFLIKEAGKHKVWVLNPERADRRFSPCSTFKIPNTLIGLECGSVRGLNERFKWDGTVRERKDANQDQTLESAFKNSIVWVYQEIARRTGPVRMKRALKDIGYGNQDISGGIDHFWLMSSLKISPREQLAMVERLYAGTLPFAAKNQALVRKLMVIDNGPNWEFSGKTGSGIAPDGTCLGWFVGSALSNGKRYYFVANIEGPEGTSGWMARDMCREALKKMGIGAGVKK